MENIVAYRDSKNRVGPITRIVRKPSGRNTRDLRSVSGCMEQLREISEIQRQLGDLAVRMDLESAKIADLRADATDAFFEAAISIAMSAVGPLGEAAAIARSLAALRFELRVLTRHDVESLPPQSFRYSG